MKNSNGIRSAIQIITRVNELLNAGLKLKEQKTTLRRVMLELANEAPAEVLEAVAVALRSSSNVIFGQRVQNALEVANSALALAEQMDAYHVEALAINETIDENVSYAGEFSPVSPPVFTPVESASGVKSNPEYVALIALVEESTHQMKVRLFCEVTHQSEQMAELMLSRSDGFLLGAIKAFTGGN